MRKLDRTVLPLGTDARIPPPFQIATAAGAQVLFGCSNEAWKSIIASVIRLPERKIINKICTAYAFSTYHMVEQRKVLATLYICTNFPKIRQLKYSATVCEPHMGYAGRTSTSCHTTTSTEIMHKSRGGQGVRTPPPPPPPH